MPSPYLPNTDADRRAMLEAIGVSSAEELFKDIPEKFRKAQFKLPQPLSELELKNELSRLSKLNASLDDYACFLGGGFYRHFIPSVVGHITGRSEFYTAYTPYQAEASQGTLQTIYEYQSLVCQLTGMEVSNAGMYDGSTAAAEAALMAVRITKKNRVAVLSTVTPRYQKVIDTYIGGHDIPCDKVVPDFASLPADCACLIAQQPNFFGYFEDAGKFAQKAHEVGALLVLSVDPISLGMFKTPGEYGVDIAVAEGQSLGNPVSFGGPALGIFACRKDYMRQMPGRIVGKTLDVEGKPGYVLTMATREQHIRRERATSNICTNEALVALAACVYLATVGKSGLRQIAELCYHKAHYAAEQISKLKGFSLAFQKPFFKEFAIRCPVAPAKINEILFKNGIIGGLDISQFVPNGMLLCVTEVNTKQQIDKLVEVLEGGGKMKHYLLPDISQAGKIGCFLPKLDVPEAKMPPQDLLNKEVKLPEVSEVELVRYFTALSKLNYEVDTGFYPLGSCTMKYNPKWHEDVARLNGFTSIHPYQPVESVQGAMQLMFELQNYLAELTGMAACSLAPMAGAQGELAGILIVRAYHLARGDKGRKKILVPDSAHGTNPATAAMCGFEINAVPSDANGNLDLESFKSMMTEDVATLTLTMPTTLGLFDPQIEEISRIVHSKGALLCGDGANFNSLIGKVKFGDLGIDCVQLNLHKTFSTPHGGGGPGSGPVCVKAELANFVPTPVIVKKNGKYDFGSPSQTIGSLGAAYGNFGVMVKAYAYIRSLGAEGLKEVSEGAVLNANYLKEKLKAYYYLPYDRTCLHEVVFSGKRQKAKGITTMDVAKRLLDYGFHPPTVYFPLIVEEAIMTEPTETESKATLDAYIETMIKIAKEAEENPDILHSAPHDTPVRRLDDVLAARKPNLRWEWGTEEQKSEG